VDNTNNNVVPGTAPQTALAGFEGGAMMCNKPLCVTLAEPDNIEELIDTARAKWAQLTGAPIDSIPWQVVFNSERPLTQAQYERGSQLEAFLRDA
jgi:hypothetical protein